MWRLRLNSQLPIRYGSGVGETDGSIDAPAVVDAFAVAVAFGSGVAIDRPTADGHYMDEDVFNYPLTVKSRVPDAWNSVKYKLNGKDVTANVFTDPEDNRKYVLVNVVPGADGAKTLVSVAPAN